MDKVNATQFDFSRTIFLSAGIADTPPEVGTLGGAAWADWLVDWDLGHPLLPQGAPRPDRLFTPIDPVGTEAFRLNKRLVDLAYSTTKDTALVDSNSAKAWRARYPGQTDQVPSVLHCDVVTGDDYWHGRELSQTASAIVKLRTGGQGTYCSTRRRIPTSLRASAVRANSTAMSTCARNFDQPYPGLSVVDSLKAHSGVFPLSIQTSTAWVPPLPTK